MADALFDNHLRFLATHRGDLRYRGRDIFVEGPTPALTSFVPGHPESRIPDDAAAVRLAPWSGTGWSERLEPLGLKPAEALSYMELANARLPLGPPSAAVTCVADDEGADAFASVQAAGFATGNREVDEWWAGYFAEQARLNHRNAEQTFYLGWAEERPVTSTLVVRTPGVTGIYAVATLPAFRRRGISAAVLDRARRDALARDHERVILQAVNGSYAETYYAKLGFVTRFISRVFRR